MPKSAEAHFEVNLRMPEVRSTLVDMSVDPDDTSADTLVPTLELSNTRILGHGLEAGGTMYCCANCARKAGVQQLRDHI